MRSRLVARSPRSARLALAAASLLALTATLTACDAGADASASASSGAGKDASSSSTGKGGDSATDGKGGADGKGGNGSASSAGSKGNDVDAAKDDYYDEDNGSTGGDNDVDGAKQDYYAKKCDNGDLNFKLKVQYQEAAYYLVTATAKPGVVCILQGAPEQVMFGSDPDTVASRAEQGSGDAIKLKGSTTAYMGVSPKSGNAGGGKQFETLVVSVSDDAASSGELTIPESVQTEISKPLVSNWHANAADVATPFL